MNKWVLLLSFGSTFAACLADPSSLSVGNKGTSGSVVGGGTSCGSAAELSVAEIIAHGTGGAMSMAIDDTNVYWLYGGQCPPCSGNSAGILRVSKCGGTPTSLLTTSPRLYNLALDDSYVYVTHQGQEIIRVPKAGGAAETVVSGISFPYAIDVDDQFVYWSGGSAPGGIFRAPKAGGQPTTIVPSVNNPWDLKVDGTTLYYSEMNSGRIMSVPKGGGTPRILASGWVGTGQIAIDLTTVYFVACSTGPCDPLLVYTVPKTGGTAQQLATSNGTDAEAGLSVGPSRVFLGRASGPMSGVVQSIAKTGGPLVDIASEPDRPFSVAVDADEAFVYWLDFDSGDVGRAPLQ